MAPVGENIRRLRRAAGLTTSQLAKLAGLSSVTMIELGRRRGCMDSLERIAGALGVPMADLFAENNNGRKRPKRVSRKAE